MFSSPPLINLTLQDIKESFFDLLPLNIGFFFFIINIWYPLNQYSGMLGTPFHGVHAARLSLPCGLPLWNDCFCAVGIPYKDVIGLIVIALAWTMLRHKLFPGQFSWKWFILIWIWSIIQWWICAFILHMIIDPTPFDLCLLEPLFTNDQIQEMMINFKNH